MLARRRRKSTAERGQVTRAVRGRPLHEVADASIRQLLEPLVRHRASPGIRATALRLRSRRSPSGGLYSVLVAKPRAGTPHSRYPAKSFST